MRRPDLRAATLSIRKCQPHSAFIGTDTVSLVIYHGEPDEIVSLEVVDAGK